MAGHATSGCSPRRTDPVLPAHPQMRGTAVTRAIDATMPADAILPGGLVAEVLDLPAAELAATRSCADISACCHRCVWVAGAAHGDADARAARAGAVAVRPRSREPAHYLHEDALAAGSATSSVTPWTALAGNLQARWLAVPPTRENTSGMSRYPAGYPYRVQARSTCGRTVSTTPNWRRGPATPWRTSLWWAWPRTAPARSSAWRVSPVCGRGRWSAPTSAAAACGPTSSKPPTARISKASSRSTGGCTRTPCGWIAAPIALDCETD